ncbi:DUF4129 domain-containing protein [Microbulbifer bruguierae]|uniref:DUF4129 domain-containing protein n=1 Tax=Microbulbifer bruguierae TaxID=3029061 RepID=A0ABY8NAW6_9GAMM|nr:DUF4129 domain-containing protein [Microbulbifer bruguierae]WGL15590.1 DUF4129 domain-containing protein [Microbulbifer bruguierae]
MNLDQLAVNARLRTGWESVDLGILLAQQHWLQMATLWLIPALPFFALWMLLFPDTPNLAILALWWFKPLFERLPLLVVSRQLFGERISIPGALGLMRRANGRDWFAWLSWRRLSFTRAFDMPVTVLENAGGKARTARLGVLHRKTASTASWLHIVGAHVEMFFGFGLAALIYLMLPEQLEINWWTILYQTETDYAWFANACTLLIMAAVAPFYICGGFMLYIGRRVELEAWDIEIHFRKMRARPANKHHRNNRSDNTRGEKTLCKGALASALICALSISILTAVVAPPPALADPVTPNQAQELIDETLAGNDFHQMDTVSGWRLKDFKSREFRFPEWFIAVIEWLESLGSDEEEESTSESDRNLGPLIAGIVEVLLWAIGISLVLYLLWQFRHQLRAAFGYRPQKKKTEIAAPETLFGLDVRQESLPDDVTAEVLRLWHSGAQREAMGLLYRASLSNLISRFDCRFQDHHTEAECAQLVHEEAQLDARLQPGLVQFFAQLTRTWQRQAYAHQPPASDQLEQLCTQWQQVFRQPEVAL